MGRGYERKQVDAEVIQRARQILCEFGQNMNLEQIEHIAQVKTWLDENVIHYPTPSKVTLCDFQLDWLKVTGTCVLEFDGTLIGNRFELSLGDNGRFKFSIPMFHSLLGVPASYAAVEFTDDTRNAINDGLSLLIPKFAGFGLHPLSREFIHISTPLQERVLDPEGFEISKRLLSGAFSVSVGTQCRSNAATT